MAISTNEKHKEYVRYAEYCLGMMNIADQESRTIQHEMATEWLKLADAVLRRLDKTARETI